MKLSIIVIGDEILLGQVTDTNSGAIARTFDPLGWQVASVSTVGDDPRVISDAVNRTFDSSDFVITTGGLGPTKDDITKTVLMENFGGHLEYDESVAENIRRVFALRGLKLNASTEAQAMVPSSCRVIQNLYGTAPIMWFERDGKVLVSMPGVPFETEGMLPEVARQAIQHYQSELRLMHRSAMVTGITESALSERLEDYERNLAPGLHLAYLPTPGLIRLRLDGQAKATDTEFEQVFNLAFEKLRDELGDYLIYDGDATAAEILLDMLRRRGLTVATAESCTGGTIASRITAIAGASDVYAGSVVSYSNDVKNRALGVDADDLAAYGAVSRPVVEQMARGVCRLTGARCSMATSGIAGPGGGSPEKPVGTVWMAWCVDGRVESRKFHFPGNRARVIDRAATEAMLQLVNQIRNHE